MALRDTGGWLAGLALVFGAGAVASGAWAVLGGMLRPGPALTARRHGTARWAGRRRVPVRARF